MRSRFYYAFSASFTIWTLIRFPGRVSVFPICSFYLKSLYVVARWVSFSRGILWSEAEGCNLNWRIIWFGNTSYFRGPGLLSTRGRRDADCRNYSFLTPYLQSRRDLTRHPRMDRFAPLELCATDRRLEEDPRQSVRGSKMKETVVWMAEI